MKKIRRVIFLFVLMFMFSSLSFAAYAEEDDIYSIYYKEFLELEHMTQEYDEELIKENWYQDASGGWHFRYAGDQLRDSMEQIGSKTYYFDKKGVMASNQFIKIYDEAGYSNIYYFGGDGAMVSGCWVQGTDGWHFADATGAIVNFGVVFDKGLYYIVSNYTMQTGVFKIEWETNRYYNEQGLKRDLPCTVGWSTVDLGTNGALTLEKLPISGGMTDDYYNKLKAEFFGNNSSDKNPVNFDKFVIADFYVDIAMAEHGIYNYQLQNRVRIEEGMQGGFVAVYYVYVPDQHAYKYLSIHFTADLLNGSPIYHYSSL